MAKPNKQIIINAIVSEIEKGQSFDTCLKLSGTKWNLTRSTFIRRWKIANQQHTEAQQLIKAAKTEVDIQNGIKEREGQIADVVERKEILSKIARGEIPLTKPMVVDGMVELVPVVPDWMDRKNAIAELNKMEGDYAPTKIAQTTKDGDDILPFNITLNLA